MGSEHPWIGSWLVGLGEVLIGKGATAEAKQFVDEGLTLQRDSLPEDHPALAISRSVLGECLTALGQHAEAEPLLIESYNRLKAAQAESGHETRKTLRRIIKLYESWDAAEPGKGYAEKAAEYRAMLPTAKGELVLEP